MWEGTRRRCEEIGKGKAEEKYWKKKDILGNTGEKQRNRMEKKGRKDNTGNRRIKEINEGIKEVNDGMRGMTWIA